MNFATMSTGGRVLFGIILPSLAGIGLWTVISWLPDPWELVAVLVLCVAGMVWATREIRWSRRMQREMEAEHAKVEAMLRGER